MQLHLKILICFYLLQVGMFSWLSAQDHSNLALVQKENWGIQLELPSHHTFDETALQVFLANEWTKNAQDGQAIAGRVVQLEKNSWLFMPYFPFTEGVRYVAFYPGVKLLKFALSKLEYPTTNLLAVFPIQDTIPENLLKIYVHFSASMSVGNSYRYLYWLNESGDTLQLPFLELEPELWNEDRTRLTLWLDPGRVKRDLVPNQLLGAPLEEGRRFTLGIDKAWKDKHGNPLAAGMEKVFWVGAADRAKPDPNLWKTGIPQHAKRTPLKLYFLEPLDHALLQHAITVWNGEQQEVAGEFTLGVGDNSWFFYPSVPWKPGEYKLLIDAKLEDLAGNNLNRPFDVDLTAKRQTTDFKSFYVLTFLIPIN